jgi:hypothetical protein
MKEMNRKGIITALVLSFLSITQLSAQETDNNTGYKTALGIRISSQDAVVNHSITLKQFISESFAAEGLLSFGDPVALGVLLESYKPIGSKSFRWFWGAGAYAAFSGNRKVGAQGALGLDLKFPSVPFNLSVDWKPELNFSEIFSFEPAAVGLSARFVFR